MTSTSQRRLLQCGLLLSTLLFHNGIGFGQEPVYWDRLTLPVSGGSFGYPESVTADLHTGEVFVCDTRYNQIAIFGDDGLFKFQINGGQDFQAARDIAIDPEGYLIVIANRGRKQAILELDFDGLFLREFQLVGFPEDLKTPRLDSIALSPAGDRIFAIDSSNMRLWIARRDGRIITAVDLGEGKTEKERQEMILRNVDVYGDMVLVPLPMEGKIRLFSLDGEARKSVGTKGTGACKLGFPTAAGLDSDGNLVIIDQQRMKIIRWSLTEDKCLGEYYGIGSTPGWFYFPIDISLDLNGKAYVAQGWQGRVQVYEGLSPAAATPSSPMPEHTTDESSTGTY